MRIPSSARALALYALPLAVLLGCLVALADNLTHTGERTAGTNSVTPRDNIVRVEDGQTACQTTLLPGGAAELQLWVKRDEGYSPNITVTFTSRGRRVSGGRLGENWAGDFLRIPIDKAARTYPDTVMCIRADGPKGFFLKGIPSQFLVATLDGAPQGAAIAVQLYREGHESWLDILPVIAHRTGVLKGSLAGAWVFWAAVGGLLLVGGLAFALVLREMRRDV